MLQEYHKIETPFERDMEGTKKLIEGKFRSKFVEFLQNVEWIWTEKIDGTNIRIYWDGHNVTIAGRTDRAILPKDLLSYLQDAFVNNEAEEMFEQMFGEKEVTLFGEGYGAGIQAVGGCYRPDKSFILFDVKIGDTFLNRESVESIAKGMGVDVVPISLRGTLKDAIDYVKSKPTSAIGTCVIEGVVGTPKIPLNDNTGKRIIVKVKCVDFC